MIITLTIAVVVTQILGYILFDRLKNFWFKYLFLGLLALISFKYLPAVLIPAIQEGQECGMPAVASTLSFWFVCGTAMVLSHGLYHLITTKKSFQ